jgi:hypothetical protein
MRKMNEVKGLHFSAPHALTCTDPLQQFRLMLELFSAFSSAVVCQGGISTDDQGEA